MFKSLHDGKKERFVRLLSAKELGVKFSIKDVQA